MSCTQYLPIFTGSSVQNWGVLLHSWGTNEGAKQLVQYCSQIVLGSSAGGRVAKVLVYPSCLSATVSSTLTNRSRFFSLSRGVSV